jgi:hypothetical protein
MADWLGGDDSIVWLGTSRARLAWRRPEQLSAALRTGANEWSIVWQACWAFGELFTLESLVTPTRKVFARSRRHECC